jgi:glycosyltransferase involved in cell wall biosynthesis
VTDAPTVTFGIPYYAGRDYLARTLQSVVAQDDRSWQAFVCDDGSEPGIAAIVEEFGDGRISYFKNPANIGMANNFNRCIDLAETDLVCVLHADDELMPSYTRTMREAALRHPGAAAFYCRTQVIDAESRPTFSLVDEVKDRLINPSVTKETLLAGEPAFFALLHGNFINAPTLCFRKRVLGGRRFPQHKFVLDWELTSQLVLDGDTIVGLPDRCYRYRRHPGAATSHYTKSQLRFREESEFFDLMIVEARRRGWARCERLARQKRIVKLNLMFFALRSLARGDLGEARRDVALLREL